MLSGEQTRSCRRYEKSVQRGAASAGRFQDCGSDLHVNCRGVHRVCRRRFKTPATTAAAALRYSTAGRLLAGSGEPLGASWSRRAFTFTIPGLPLGARYWACYF